VTKFQTTKHAARGNAGGVFFRVASRNAGAKFGMIFCPHLEAALHKRRIGNFVELTPNLAGTFIAICHSTD
jgi:hypothetical protein